MPGDPGAQGCVSEHLARLELLAGTPVTMVVSGGLTEGTG